jgi:hypothetical protein
MRDTVPQHIIVAFKNFDEDFGGFPGTWKKLIATTTPATPARNARGPAPASIPEERSNLLADDPLLTLRTPEHARIGHSRMAVAPADETTVEGARGERGRSSWSGRKVQKPRNYWEVRTGLLWHLPCV